MLFRVNSDNPQLRLIRQAAEMLRDGEVIALPTDTVYALGCRLTDKKAMQKLYWIKHVDKGHPMALLCADLKDIAFYAKVSNPTYKILRRYLPGPYTFILAATREVPKLMLTKQKTVGLRIPNNNIVQALVAELGEPVLTTSAELPDYDQFYDAEEIEERIGKQLGCVIDGGPSSKDRSTIVDLSSDVPVLLREGKGEFYE